MEILLDTNFILTCAKQKLDFERLVNEIADEKIEWLVPIDVLDEIERLKNRDVSELAFQIIKSLNPKIIKLKGENPNVDVKIANYIAGKLIVLATLDKNLKSRVGNKILTIRGKNNFVII